MSSEYRDAMDRLKRAIAEAEAAVARQPEPPKANEDALMDAFNSSLGSNSAHALTEQFASDYVNREDRKNTTDRRLDGNEGA